MSSAQGIRAGKAYVELFTDNSRFNTGLKAAQERLKAFGNSLRQAGQTMSIVGAAAFAPFVLSVKSFIDAARDGKVAGGDLAKAVDLKKTLNETTNSINGLQIAVGSALAPMIMSLAKIVSSVVEKIKVWVQENPGLVTGIALVGAAVAGLGVGLLGMGVAIQAASWALGGMVILWSGLVAGLALLKAAFLSVQLSALILPAAFLSIAYGLYGFIQSTDTGREAIDDLGTGFRHLKQDAKDSWQGIQDALATGDIGGAMKVAWAFVKLEWTRGSNWLIDKAQSLASIVSKVFLDVGFSINYSFRFVINAIANGMDELEKKVGSTMYNILIFGRRISDETKQKWSDAYSTVMKQPLKKVAPTTSESRIATRNADLEAFKQSWTDAKAAIDSWNTNSTQARSDETAKLQTELEALVAALAANRQKADEDNKNRGDAIRNQMDPQTKADVFGSFSAAASYGIGIGSTAIERTAKASEFSAKQLESINGKFDKLTFATFTP